MHQSMGLERPPDNTADCRATHHEFRVSKWKLGPDDTRAMFGKCGPRVRREICESVTLELRHVVDLTMDYRLMQLK